MAKRDSKVDQYPITDIKPENISAASSNAKEEDSSEEPIRLSVRGAVWETGSGPLSAFEVKVESNSNTGRYEQDKILAEQLENVDFYIEQGFLDVALSTLERLEVLFPEHPLITERLDRMAHAEKTGNFIEPITSHATAPVTKSPAKTETNQTNEDRATNTTSSRGESTVPLIFAHTASHSVVTPLDKPLDKPIDKPKFEPLPKISNNIAKSGLESIIDTEESTEEMYQTISDEEETQSNLPLLASAPNFNSILDELDSELETDPNEDFQTHFTVGQAYFDIELFDDAIEEFQVAYRIIQAIESHPQAFQCSFMLGRCFRIKEMVRPALMWIRRALSAKSATASELLDAQYELANIHEELGESLLALELYEQIAKTQPNFKDIADRIILLGKDSLRQ